MTYFHYHQKCRDITDNRGDIELDLIESSRKNCIYLKLIRIVSIQSKSTGFENYLDVIKKAMIYFIITRSVRIFLTIEVILNLI